jgi:phosphoribosylamine--glycine ligase
MHRMMTDFAQVLLAAAHGELGGLKLAWRDGPSVCVVLASGGYPGAYETGKPIDGIDAAEATGATVFHAGTKKRATSLETAGGRVLGVTASGPDLAAAIQYTYEGVRAIHFEGMHYRTDIGAKGLRRYNKGIAGT